MSEANTPFIVASSINVTQGSIIAFNSQLLAPPFRLPYLIRELRFYSRFDASVGASAAKLGAQVQIALGHKALTNGFIPVGMLCPQVQLATDEGITVGDTFSLFRWVLPKPMYCRAGEGIFASALNLFTAQVKTLTLEMSVVGEVLPAGAPMPKTTAVPFASAFSTAAAAPYAASDGVAMRNPFSDKTLHMQRFMGRGYLQHTVNMHLLWTDADTTDANAPIVTLVDSEDRTGILPSPGVLFGEGFDARTSCLEHRRPLKPKGWYQATLTNIASANNTYWISMIGHRDEVIS